MNRKSFVKSLGALGALSLTSMTLLDLEKLSETLQKSERMPALFVGHGNPINAILKNEFSQEWRNVGARLKPQMILCISAHWESQGTFVTGETSPKTIHDFGGFPQALFDVQYPVPGSPELAKTIQQTITEPAVHLTDKWGLDHGSWSVLIQMFPEANIPVLQMSLDRNLSPQQMYDLGKQLSFLRDRGVLVVGSGNIVHNLRYANLREANPKPYDWAIEFDNQVKHLLDSRDHQSLINFKKLGNAANMSIPTDEHYIPMLYILGLQGKNEQIQYFNDSIAFGSGSMRSFVVT